MSRATVGGQCCDCVASGSDSDSDSLRPVSAIGARAEATRYLDPRSPHQPLYI